jgi:hypothetical protein
LEGTVEDEAVDLVLLGALCVVFEGCAHTDEPDGCNCAHGTSPEVVVVDTEFVVDVLDNGFDIVFFEVAQ